MAAPPVIAAVADGNVLTETLWNTGPAALDSWMGNPPSAVLTQTVAQSIPNNAATSVTFDHTVRDNYGGHRSAGVSGDAYYAPAAGVYLVQATVNLNWTGASGKAVGAYLILSNATHVGGGRGAGHPGPGQVPDRTGRAHPDDRPRTSCSCACSRTPGRPRPPAPTESAAG